MQLDRIAFQYPDGTSAGYDFHPQVTVIDVHPAHRRALAEHLLSSLWTTSPGVHVEFTTDDGAALVAFRPYGAAPRVIDIDRGTALTDEFRRGAGIDVLARLGVLTDRIAAILLADRSDLALVDPTEAWTTRLARHDPADVLAAAHAAVTAEKALADATAPLRLGGTADGALAEPERDRQATTPRATIRQATIRQATIRVEQRHERLRLATLVIGLVGPLGAVVGLRRLGTPVSLGIILASLTLGLVCLWRERTLTRLIDAGFGPPVQAGIDGPDRLGGPVERPPDDPIRRRQLLEAADRFAVTAAAWRALAGDIPATWVLAHGDRLSEAAALVPGAAGPGPTASTDDRADDRELEMLRAGLMSRVRAVRELGGGERLPLVLDDPLTGLAAPDKAAMLGFLGRLAPEQQLVICTDDVDLVTWGRLEAALERASFIDVNPGRPRTPTGSAAPS